MPNGDFRKDQKQELSKDIVGIEPDVPRQKTQCGMHKRISLAMQQNIHTNRFIF